MSVTVEILEGNLRRLVVTFLVPDDDSDLDDLTTWVQTDPTTVTFTRRRMDDPAASLETWTYAGGQITRDSEGVYGKVLSFLDDGTYILGAEGTGACQTYVETTLVVHNAKARTS